MASTGDVELRSHGYQVLRKRWENTGRDDELIRSSETMNPCSVSAVYKWHERFRNGRKSTEEYSRDGPPCIVKMTMKDIIF